MRKIFCPLTELTEGIGVSRGDGDGEGIGGMVQLHCKKRSVPAVRPRASSSVPRVCGQAMRVPLR